MKRISIAFFLISVLLVVSCKNTTVHETPTSGTIRIAVDETFGPIISSEIDVFETIYQSAIVLDKVCPEVDAFNLMLKDSVRMIVATRKLNKEETDFFNSKNIFPKELKIAVDGIAFIVHKDNPDTLLTTAMIRRILLGEIESWDQINPESKLGPIKMIFDNPNSSTANYAVNVICGTTNLSPNLSAVNSNLDVIDFVSKTQNSIGIIGVSWISNHKDSTCMGFLDKIKVVALSKESFANRDNSFQPYQAYLANGQYPYPRDIYIINSDPKVGLCTGFASFIASDRGQRIILKAGILPATQPLRIIQVKENY